MASSVEVRAGEVARGRRPLFRGRGEQKRFPPYELVEGDLVERAEGALGRLERLYHKGQAKAWDGREVLAGLIAEHGPPKLPEKQKAAALKILSVLLWGELAARVISADLAERIDDIPAKMAATSQAHDEARHFYVLRDYLRALGEPVPRLGGISRRLLNRIIDAPSVVHKLVGMQLLVEANALALFRALAGGDLDPVLLGLLPYYERDEARHVGLGVIYLPTLLRNLDAFEAASVAAFEIGCVGLLVSAGMLLREDFDALGIPARAVTERTLAHQQEIVREILAGAGSDPGDRRRATRGIVDPLGAVGPAIAGFFFPPGGRGTGSPVKRAALGLWERAARRADHAFA